MAETVWATAVARAANRAATRAHYAAYLDIQSREWPLSATALCSTTGKPVRVYNQNATNSGTSPRYCPIDEMPLCPPCSQIAERDGLEAK